MHLHDVKSASASPETNPLSMLHLGNSARQHEWLAVGTQVAAPAQAGKEWVQAEHVVECTPRGRAMSILLRWSIKAAAQHILQGTAWSCLVGAAEECCARLSKTNSAGLAECMPAVMQGMAYDSGSARHNLGRLSCCVLAGVS